MNNDIVYEILMNAPMTSFVNLCQTNSQFRKQCTPAMWQIKFNQYNIPYHLPVSNWALLYDEYQFGQDNAIAIDTILLTIIKNEGTYLKKTLSNKQLIKMLEDLGADNMKNNKIHLFNYRYRTNTDSLQLRSLGMKFIIAPHVVLDGPLIKRLIIKLIYYGYL